MRSKLTPPKVFIAAWGFQIAVSVVGSIGAEDYRLGLLTVILCFVGVLSVLCGCFFGYGSKIPRVRAWAPISGRVKYIIAVLLMLGFVGAVFAAREWISLGVNPLRGSSLYDMNVAYSTSRDSFGGVSGRLHALVPVALLYVLFCRRASLIEPTHALVLVLILAALLISPRRATIITTALAAVFLWMLGKPLPIRRWLAYFIPAMFAIFAFLGYSQFKLGKAAEYTLASTVDMILTYAGSSVYVMDGLIHTDHLEDTFVLLNLPARAVNAVLGSNLQVDLSVPFVYDPVVSNTVPLFYYLYKSSSWLGLCGVSFLIGWISVISYRIAERTGSFGANLVSALMMCGLVLSIRENFFFSYDFLWWAVVGIVISWVSGQRFRV